MKYLIVFIIFLSSGSSYINPTQEFYDTPDPGVVDDGNYFYAATTSGWDSSYFPIWQSKDMTDWKQVGWGIIKENKPVWSDRDFWAPEIHIINNLYFLYYAARDKTGHLCIGVGYSDRPQGPSTHSANPLLRNE